MSGNVLIAAPVHPVLTEGLIAAGYTLTIREKITQQEAMALVPDCTGIITSTRLQVDRALIDAAPKLRWIGRMGSGMEVIDVDYATEKGIRCAGSPDGNCNAVAEHALGLLLNLTKRIHSSANEVVEGKWLREENRGMELEGKTIGIIGFGHTGSAFARKLQGFDMRILAFDILPIQNAPAYVEAVDLQTIFKDATIISFHVPITKDTKNYLDEKFLLEMQQRFLLINTSRGEVIHTGVLKDGLESGKIRGAGIDVWPEEPMEKMGADEILKLNAIKKMEQVIITPHIAGYSHEAIFKMSKSLLEKLITD